MLSVHTGHWAGLVRFAAYVSMEGETGCERLGGNFCRFGVLEGAVTGGNGCRQALLCSGREVGISILGDSGLLTPVELHYIQKCIMRIATNSGTLR